MPPLTPLPISGQVLDVDNSKANGIPVEIHNLKTGDLATGKTDSNGVYIIDLANFPDFTRTSNGPLLIRAFVYRTIFSSAERTAVLDTGAGELTDQDLTLVAERPEQEKDDHEKRERKEHHTTANAKKVILTNSLGEESEGPLDKFRASGTVIDGKIRYYPFLDKFGNWYVRRDDLTDSNNRTYRYAKGIKNFPSNSLTALQALTYDLFNNVF